MNTEKKPFNHYKLRPQPPYQQHPAGEVYYASGVDIQEAAEELVKRRQNLKDVMFGVWFEGSEDLRQTELKRGAFLGFVKVMQ